MVKYHINATYKGTSKIINAHCGTYYLGFILNQVIIAVTACYSSYLNNFGLTED